MIKIRDGHAVRNFACYLAIGVNLDGDRDVLGMWFQKTEGAKFWLGVLTDLKTRGVQDVLVCCVDGLKGFPKRSRPSSPTPGCRRASCTPSARRCGSCPTRTRRRSPPTCARSTPPLTETTPSGNSSVSPRPGIRDPDDLRLVDRNWERIVPFLAFPPDVRRAVYTTNTIEALNRQIRKIIKTRGSFPDEDSARKLLYLAISRAQQKWRHAYNWSSALTAFRIHFGDRIPDGAI